MTAPVVLRWPGWPWVFCVPAVSESLYDELSERNHLILDDWNASIAYQRDVLAKLSPVPATGKRVHYYDCGIGTQAIGLALLGFTVEGPGLAPASIDRARWEATARGLKAEFRSDDMRTLSTAPLNSD